MTQPTDADDPEGADDARDTVARRRDVRGARRREQILHLLQTVESGSLSVEEIADRFGVSFATVRRDLSRLHQDRHITRTYGGVALTSRPNRAFISVTSSSPARRTPSAGSPPSW